MKNPVKRPSKFVAKPHQKRTVDKPLQKQLQKPQTQEQEELEAEVQDRIYGNM